MTAILLQKQDVPSCGTEVLPSAVGMSVLVIANTNVESRFLLSSSSQ